MELHNCQIGQLFEAGSNPTFHYEAGSTNYFTPTPNANAGEMLRNPRAAIVEAQAEKEQESTALPIVRAEGEQRTCGAGNIPALTSDREQNTSLLNANATEGVKNQREAIVEAQVEKENNVNAGEILRNQQESTHCAPNTGLLNMTASVGVKNPRAAIVEGTEKEESVSRVTFAYLVRAGRNQQQIAELLETLRVKTQGHAPELVSRLLAYQREGIIELPKDKPTEIYRELGRCYPEIACTLSAFRSAFYRLK